MVTDSYYGDYYYIYKVKAESRRSSVEVGAFEASKTSSTTTTMASSMMANLSMMTSIMMTVAKSEMKMLKDMRAFMVKIGILHLFSAKGRIG